MKRTGSRCLPLQFVSNLRESRFMRRIETTLRFVRRLWASNPRWQKAQEGYITVPRIKHQWVRATLFPTFYSFWIHPTITWFSIGGKTVLRAGPRGPPPTVLLLQCIRATLFLIAYSFPSSPIVTWLLDGRWTVKWAGPRRPPPPMVLLIHQIRAILVLTVYWFRRSPLCYLPCRW